MVSPFFLLKCVGKVAANAFGGGIAGDLLFEGLPELADNVWRWWHKDRDEGQRRQDLAAVAAITPAQLRQELPELILEVAGDRPPAEQKQLEIYLSLIPGQVRKSLRRPADPTGTTVGLDLMPRKAEDLLAFLPGKLPRFKPGDRPLHPVDWELEELLGVGGFGEVWKARHPLLDSVPPVALKFCLEPSSAQYLRNEAAVLDRVMRQGRHPGMVTLLHTYLGAETPCLEYEFVAGGDLAGLIRQYHTDPAGVKVSELCGVFLELAEILAHAHANNPPIVHRDLKPANVLVETTPDGKRRLKVADFGIGGLATRQALAQHTRGGTGRGMFLCTALRGSCTPLYAGPQQTRGEGPDPRDDVYSLGVIGYQMLTGDLTNGAPAGTRWQRRLADAGVPQGLIDVLADCFEHDLADRIADAGELAKRLRATLPTAPAVVATPTPQAPLPPLAPLPPMRPLAPMAPMKPMTPLAPLMALRQPETERLRRETEESARRKKEEWQIEVAELSGGIFTNARDAGLWSRRAEAHRQLGDHVKAIADATEAVRLDARRAEAFATRGSAYRMRGQLDLAVVDCTEALRLDPRNVVAWFNRGEAHRLKREIDKAVADFTRAIDLDPAYAWAYGSRGAARQQVRDYDRALADLNESLRLEPGYAWARVVRAETHRLRGDFDAAVADCDEALALKPDDFMAFATRGAAYRQKGDFATAQADLSQSLRLKPDYQWAKDQLDLARRRHR